MPIKAREVREQLKNVVDPRLLKILELMAEDLAYHKQLLNMMAGMMDQMADNHAKLFHVAGKIHEQGIASQLKNKTTEIQKNLGDEQLDNALRRTDET